MTALLGLDSVSAGYAEATIIDRVSLSLDDGDSLAVLGRNGVGKTTLLRTVMGLTTLHDGRLEWRGRSLLGVPVSARARLGIGWVPQQRGVWRSLTVDEHLSAVARPGRWTIDAVYQLLPSLAQRRARLGGQLSGGEQQMLALGRALVVNPRLLLLDEPMEGLAPIVVQQLARVIGDLAASGGMAIVIVEQHARLALSIARRAIVLDRGSVSYEGDSAALLADRERLEALVAIR